MKIIDILKFVALVLITICIIGCLTYTTQIDEVNFYDLSGKAMTIKKLPFNLKDTCDILIINNLDK